MKGLMLACAVVLLAGFALAQSDEDEKVAVGYMPKHCKQTVYDEEKADYTYGYTCFYPKKTLLETYLSYRKEMMQNHPNSYYERWRSKLAVGKDYSDELKASREIWRDDKIEKEEYVELTISYTWNGTKELNVWEGGEAGEVTSTFRQQANGTLLSVEEYID
jgi:hypothetical protein